MMNGQGERRASVIWALGLWLSWAGVSGCDRELEPQLQPEAPAETAQAEPGALTLDDGAGAHPRDGFDRAEHAAHAHNGHHHHHDHEGPMTDPTPYTLDQDRDGRVLFGIERPAPRFTDVDRILDVTLRVPGAEEVSLGAVIDARFIPDSEDFLLLRPDGTLVRSVDGTERTVAANVDGPIGLSADGRRATWVTGEMPQFEVVVWDLERGTEVFRSTDLISAWCPTLSPDGSTLVVVSSLDESPGLYRIPLDEPSARERLHAHVDPELLPAGPASPRWSDDGLVFGDRDDVWMLAWETGERTHVGAGTLVGEAAWIGRVQDERRLWAEEVLEIQWEDGEPEPEFRTQGATP